MTLEDPGPVELEFQRLIEEPPPADCDCTMHDEIAGLVEERARLRAAIDMIAESVMVKIVVLKDGHETTWGCGICQGEYQRRDGPDGRGVYEHRSWCPRAREEVR